MSITYPRLIGYGAYNLCFDSKLGKPEPATSTSLDFFDYIRSKKDRTKSINLVKVILFRKSTIEDLPASRAIPLYQYGAGGAVVINQSFVNNLVNLVAKAARTGFVVQVCIFHFQALQVALGEYPEIVPAILDPNKVGTDICSRCLNFFDVNNTARLNEQKKLVNTIATSLKGHDNVIWELCNEIRVRNCADLNTAHCKIVPWLRAMRAELRAVIPDAYVTTSTGKSIENTGTGERNEEITFAHTGRTCQNPPLDAEYFDLHYGQWFEYPDLNGDGTTVPEGVLQAKSRCVGYNPSLKHILINDDGAHDNKTVADVKFWASEAFRVRLSFSSKQPYEPGRRFNDQMLFALQEASNNFTSVL